jgi:hypothetical protein
MSYCIRIKRPKPYDHFVWSVEEADDIFLHPVQKFNPNHEPAGSPIGGRFASGDGGSGSVMVTDRLGNKVEVNQHSSLARWLVQRPDGSWGIDPMRELLHQQIVNKILDGAKRQNGPLTLYMTGGGPAAGKSSILKGILPDDAVMVDPDQIKTMLPEWDTMTAAHDTTVGSYLHEESSLIRKRLEAAAIAGNYSVILDTTGDSSVDKLSDNLAKYRNAGYKINAYYASNDPDLAVRLADARGDQTGRYVPENVLREAHANVSITYPKAVARGVYDHSELYDTNINGSPRLVATSDGENLHIKNNALWNDFVAKGDSEYATAKADNTPREMVSTDMATQMVVAIMLKSPKPKDLTPAQSAFWDRVAADCKKCPKGQFVDPGNELDGHDLTNLYSGSLAQKYATTAGALDRSVQWVPIKKTDGEKQIVYGEVYAPYVLDTYGEFMTPEDIETMAHRFMQLDLTKVIDTQHDNQPNGSFPVESFHRPRR